MECIVPEMKEEKTKILGARCLSPLPLFILQ